MYKIFICFRNIKIEVLSLDFYYFFTLLIENVSHILIPFIDFMKATETVSISLKKSKIFPILNVRCLVVKFGILMPNF